MKLNIEVGFYLPVSVEEKGYLKYQSSVMCNDSLQYEKIEEQAHTLRVVDEELRKAIHAIDKRLKCENKGKYAFFSPRTDGFDEYGNPIITS